MKSRSKTFRLIMGFSALLIFFFFQGSTDHTDGCTMGPCSGDPTDILEGYGWIKVNNATPYFISVLVAPWDNQKWGYREYTVRNDPSYIKFDVTNGEYIVWAFRINPVDKSLKFIDSYPAFIETGSIVEITVTTPMVF